MNIRLFNWKRVNSQIPTAILIKYYQYVHKTEFDHCGIVVVDQKGEQYVLEKSWGRYKLQRYVATINDSDYDQIMLLPLEPRDMLTRQANQNLFHYALDISKSNNSASWTQLLPWFLSFFRTGLFGGACPNSSFIIACLCQLGLTSSIGTEGNRHCISLRDLPDIRFHHHVVGEQGTSEQSTKIMSFGDNILIRTK